MSESESNFLSEELEMLHKLIITKAGRQALAKVLKDYGEKCGQSPFLPQGIGHLHINILFD